MFLSRIYADHCESCTLEEYYLKSNFSSPNTMEDCQDILTKTSVVSGFAFLLNEPR